MEEEVLTDKLRECNLSKEAIFSTQSLSISQSFKFKTSIIGHFFTNELTPVLVIYKINNFLYRAEPNC